MNQEILDAAGEVCEGPPELDYDVLLKGRSNTQGRAGFDNARGRRQDQGWRALRRRKLKKDDEPTLCYVFARGRLCRNSDSCRFSHDISTMPTPNSELPQAVDETESNPNSPTSMAVGQGLTFDKHTEELWFGNGPTAVTANFSRLLELGRPNIPGIIAPVRPSTACSPPTGWGEPAPLGGPLSTPGKGGEGGGAVDDAQAEWQKRTDLEAWVKEQRGHLGSEDIPQESDDAETLDWADSIAQEKESRENDCKRDEKPVCRYGMKATCKNRGNCEFSYRGEPGSSVSHGYQKPLCTFYARNGRCRDGDSCRFLHGRSRESQPEMKEDVRCSHFAKFGTCNYGETCRFSHGLTSMLSVREEAVQETAKDKEFCSHFMKFGRCKYGEECRFSHGVPPNSPDHQTDTNAGGEVWQGPVATESKRICSFYLQGRCRFGSQCRSLHAPPAVTSAKPKENPIYNPQKEKRITENWRQRPMNWLGYCSK
ncbi:hypothetical protein G7K_3933-t1 [Saitoella complicata NRRL Y-17804]|uniref:C3H1-type domain-containing protein n=1 Tax=Saitoella complicata (strain BCRC 22490 / CBS 7301 / JCM 7358 / NBRC 10748 / NRRL Y-17804) TaxID=698492 RepID=A0A0E9NJA9_SAICN|nr:hypothetical protein G7K_3933-t1 [Saitoella complicata NRRL Y-17804]